MPKIEVFEKTLHNYIGKEYTRTALEEIFPAAKAELDGVDDEAGILKVELNDTNRPDLWSTAGLGRQLRQFEGGPAGDYPFFSSCSSQQEAGERIVKVDPALQKTRPYITAFAVTGKKIDEATLKDLIQTQEKLCWNFGQKRKSIAMGVYRSDLISFPVSYRAADPDKTRFVPLQMEEELSLREICREHPKGREFGPIVENLEAYPFLEDSQGGVLSFPPVINSDRIGAVQEGDENLFIELTGTDIHSLTLAGSIAACDLADAGFTILPVKVVYPYDTALGREVVSPFYFQEKAEAEVSFVRRWLGIDISGEEIVKALKRMGCRAEEHGETVQLTVPPYRNDFLHSVDVVEDIMIGYGMERFEPRMPNDMTVGRLSPQEELSRQIQDLMVGMGYQEMIYNYLGSGKDYIEKMNLSGEGFVQIANPMTENYEYVRSSILPALLESESVSAHAVYPHAIFEVGKVAFLEPEENSGTRTRDYLGFLMADGDADFNRITSHVSALFYYLSREYQLEERQDPRFIPGRCASILIGGKAIGVLGEIHPVVLEKWGIQVPSIACELDIDELLE